MDESGGMTLNNDSIKETMKMIQMQGQMQQQEVMTQVKMIFYCCVFLYLLTFLIY